MDLNLFREISTKKNQGFEILGQLSSAHTRHIYYLISQTSEKERLQEELEEAKDKARRRSTGNIKFIGELFKLRMLTEAIMHDCVVKLLKNHDDESLECLCRLLTTIGKDLDFEKAKVTQAAESLKDKLISLIGYVKD